MGLDVWVRDNLNISRESVSASDGFCSNLKASWHPRCGRYDGKSDGSLIASCPQREGRFDGVSRPALG
jgi:hypothetical protein